MRRLGLAAMALLAASTAQAETLRVESARPARSDDLAALRTITVEPLGGRSGGALGIMVEDALREVDLGTGPWFRIVPASVGNIAVDAALRGTADRDAELTDYTEERERCVRDANNKCSDTKEKYTVPCLRRRVGVTATLRLIRRDGTLLWSDNGTEPYEDSKCADSSGKSRPLAEIEKMLAGRIAERLRRDLAPQRGSADIRVDESRKGLAKPDAESFKAAVRAVRESRGGEACAAWERLGVTYPQHLPTQFNLGLCAEASGDAAKAAQQYELALRLNPRSTAAKDGLARLDANARALRQIEAHRLD